MDKILKDNGWKKVRQCGSHVTYKKNGMSSIVTVPNHKGRSISIGVVRDIEKKTGIDLLR